MSQTQLGEISKFLFSPVTFLLYVAAMGTYLYAMAFTKVDRKKGETSKAGNRALTVATWLAVLGATAHVAHIITRSFAAGRPPLGNMFEFSSLMALIAVVGGLVVFQWRLKKPEVMGFLLLGTLLTLGLSTFLYTAPGPLMPILDSWWRAIHVSAIVLAAGIFTMAFVFTALYLMRDAAERRVAELQTERASGSTVGAAYAPTSVEPESGDTIDDAVLEHTSPDAPEDEPEVDDTAAYAVALRHAIAQRVPFRGRTYHFPVKIAAWTALVAAVFSLVFQRPSATISMPLVAVAVVAIAWWFLPSLPSAATLDSLAYRTTAFGFPVWTFAVIAGSIWAEQSWGRYWGWDPKETSAFLTWVAYAGYLHARATHGVRGRKAAWFGIGAFAILMFTYYVVNMFVVGLHSYAGLPR